METAAASSSAWVRVCRVAGGLVGTSINVLLMVGAADAELSFFRATDEAKAYAKNPGRYEKVQDKTDLPGFFNETRLYYVERIPVLRIQSDQIGSVVVERHPLVISDEDQMKELSGGWSKEELTSKEQSGQMFFTLVFSLEKAGAKRLNDFIRNHVGERFDLRLRNQRLGVVQLTGGAASNVFKTHLLALDRSRLEAILSPIKSRVTWK